MLAKFNHVLFFILVGIGITTPVYATAMFNATATTTVTLIGFADNSGPLSIQPADLRISASAAIFNIVEETIDAATANASGNVFVNAIDIEDLGIGEGTVQEATAEGFANSASFSLSLASYLTDGFVVIDNSSANDYIINFALTYIYEVTASTDAVFDSAIAEIFISVADSADNLLVDIVASADTNLSDGTVTGNNTVQLSIFVPSEDTEELTILNDADGFAIAFAISTPPTLFLLFGGIVGLALFHFLNFKYFTSGPLTSRH